MCFKKLIKKFNCLKRFDKLIRSGKIKTVKKTGCVKLKCHKELLDEILDAYNSYHLKPISNEITAHRVQEKFDYINSKISELESKS